MKKSIYILAMMLLFITNLSYVDAACDESRQADYNELRSINLGTFNEYGYKITEQYLKLKQGYDVNGTLGANNLKNLDSLATTGYKYLPDNLNNRGYLTNLQSALKKGEKFKNSDGVYSEIRKSIENYLYCTEIKKITGTIEASPTSGNAPLNVTLRAKVVDPTGTIIPKDNYIWWVDSAGTRKIIGKGLSINYTLNDEGKFSIFLDVLSNHRNTAKYIDVLPFRSRADITVNQKVANINIKVNEKVLRNEDSLKFSPDEASYGIIFDATSSTPTSGTKFLRTSWDFGNGVKREYEGSPRIERVTYGAEGDFIVKLKLKTNELHEVERKFIVSIHKPIATISTTQDQGFIGDKFTFSANPSVFEKNLTYNWEIVDIEKNDVILKKSGNLFTYEFLSKGKFNVKLKVTDPSGETDNDNRIIYINSRAPVAEFSYSIPKTNKPNRILFDATKSYDQDYTDDGKLEFSWEIDGQKIELENPNYNGSLGYYTFDSIGEHSVVLEVTDPDGIKSQKKDKVRVNSVLSVEFTSTPLVIQRNSYIRFIANSPEAKSFKWDFGDGNIILGSSSMLNHYYEKSGTFDVKLEVSDSEGNTNTFTRKVYVSDSDYPFALIEVQYENGFDVNFDENGCDGKGAYVIDRVSNIKFNGQSSINIDGQTSGLEYSWKVGVDKFSSSSTFTRKFDEMGCFPVKLSVKSNKNKKSHTQDTYVEVRNLKPSLSSLNIQAIDVASDPVIVNLSAIGAKDRDGVILSYLWYYYTDSDDEPQDYRVTINPTTTFVLPKISGRYYFAVVLKDNNEEKFSSTELSSKSFLDLVGDNTNTPIVDLTVDDSSVSVGDEVVFNVRVRNVLGQDLSTKAIYSWDFDGDGFYDKEVTGKTSMTHKFEKAGEYHVKVKAKYKGISNVKNVTINVVNNLEPDFDYISILNKYIFFNKSTGKYNSIIWELGDGNIKDGEDNLVYTYDDGKSSHDVTLKISDGNKLKYITKTVVRNPKNIIKANKDGLNVFSTPEITGSGNLVLNNSKERFFIYLGDSKGDYKEYIVDFDINYDSDLNGGKDDDIDNRNHSSYANGDPLEIKLNDSKNQTIKITLKDSNGKIVEQKNLEIIKEYIKDEEKNINDIVFNGVTESEKQKIELLKGYISNLPKDFRASGMKYLERLQGEWFDQTEKTKIIIEFEGFLDNPEIKNSEEIIILLESILVEGEVDKSQKSITFNALKNLLREEIVCSYDSNLYQTCREYLVSILEDIRDSNDIEKNKELSKVILQAVLDDQIMSDKEKLDFKEILKGLIYSGTDITKIPTEETTVENTSFFAKIIGFFKGAATITFIFVVLILALIVGFYIYFKFANKDKNKGFEEFIIEKTSNDSSSDILGGLGEEIKKDEINEVKQESVNNDLKEEKSTVPDWLKSSFTQTTQEQSTDLKKENDILGTEIVENKIEEKNPFSYDDKVEENTVLTTNTENKEDKTEISNDIDNISIDTDEQNKIDLSEEQGTSQEQDKNITTSDENLSVPDWLKGSFDTPKEDVQNSIDTIDEVSKDLPESKDETQEETVIDSTSNESIVSTEENLSVPDWLKGSLDTVETKSIDESTQLIDNEKEVVIKEEKPKEQKQKSKEKKVLKESKKLEDNNLEEITKVDEAVIPDWLRGSLEDDSSSKNNTKKTTSKDKKNDEKTTTNGDELWQDGMKIPDWLDDNTQADDNQNKK